MRTLAYSPPILPLSIILLLLLRLGLQFALYAAGFEAITADEFGRIVLAGRWAQQPYLVWQGGWLPFSLYLFGAALRLVWDLLWVPRAIAIVAGLASIILMYHYAWLTFDDRRVALLSALFLALNPFHVRLSSVPLTEILYAALVLAAAWAYAVHRRSASIGHLYLAAITLAIANGVRFEAWVVSACFSLFVFGERVLARRAGQTGPALPTLVSVLLPWTFPVAWLLASYLHSGELFASLEVVRDYKARWHAPGTDYGAYLRTFFAGDPLLTVLAPLALLYLLPRLRQPVVLWYLSLATIPLVIFIALHRGQPEPSGISLRYMSVFMFLLYPALAFFLISLLGRLPFSAPARNALLAALLLAFLGFQLVSNFRFGNDLSANGLKVGQAIRQLRSQDPAIAAMPVMIELSYWEYLAIQVGANDVSTVLYDRQLDLDGRSSVSLIATDQAALRDCLASHNVSYVILKSPHLKAALESEMGFEASQAVNGYSFYPVPSVTGQATHPEACPLR